MVLEDLKLMLKIKPIGVQTHNILKLQTLKQTRQENEFSPDETRYGRRDWRQ